MKTILFIISQYCEQILNFIIFYIFLEFFRFFCYNIPTTKYQKRSIYGIHQRKRKDPTGDQAYS